MRAITWARPWEISPMPSHFGFTRQGLYPRMGFKLGEWHDVAQYGLRLTPQDRPPEPLFRTEGGTQG